MVGRPGFGKRRIEFSSLVATISGALALAVCAYLVASQNALEALLHALFPDIAEPLYTRASLAALLGEHLILVGLSSLAALAIGIALGAFVTRPAGEAFARPLLDLAALSQTFPPAAVIALAVPILGFGYEPAFLALFLYGIFPIAGNTVSGLRSIQSSVRESAIGMGMGPLHVLYSIELPLAAPAIAAGVRTSVVANVGTATIGAAVGAGGLGAPIVAGLIRDNPAMVLEGAFAAAVLAWILDAALGRLAAFLSRSSHGELPPQARNYKRRSAA